MSDRHLILKIISILFLFSILCQEFNYCCCAFSFNTVIIIGSGTRSRTVQQDGISLMPRSLSSSSSSSSELFMTSSASTSVSAPAPVSVSVSVSVSVTEEDSEEEIESAKRKLKEKFETLRRGFPKNANIVNAGGWYNLEQLSHDPKSTLTQFIIDGIKKEDVQHHHHQESKSSSEEKEKHHDHEEIEKENQERDNEKLNALCLLLYGMGKGFIADTMDGEWDIVFTKSSTKSTTTGTSTTATTTTSSSRNTVAIGGDNNNNSNKSKKNMGNRLFFNIQKLLFQKRYTFLKWGLLTNTIKYLPISENYSISSKGKIVVRRIVCTLLNRIFKWWKLPSIKLPTIRSIKKRYLDIIYLDDDICISGSGFGSGFSSGGDSSESGRQNQNQLFIHFRPKYLQTMMSQYNRFTATTTTLSGSGIGHSNSNSNNYGDILDDSLC